jgi:hypothetical protein
MKCARCQDTYWVCELGADHQRIPFTAPTPSKGKFANSPPLILSSSSPGSDYETYVPTGQDVGLIDRVNNVDFCPAFNCISDALHRNVIMALCRIWDTRADTANLTRLASEFRDPKVIADLVSIGCKVDASQLKKWLTEIDAVSKSDELSALMRARHRALAHTPSPNVLYKGKARIAEYGDERKVMEKTIPLVEQAGAFIGYSCVMPFDEPAADSA